MENQLRERLLHTCTWCLKTIPEGEELFAFGAKASEKIDLNNKQGEFVSLKMALKDKTIVALVATQDSEAKRQGLDLIFVTCSQECAEDLKKAFELERDMFRD